MRSKGLVVPAAVVLAVIATLAVFFYLRGVEEDSTTSAEMVSVVVSDQDIPAGTELDDLVSAQVFDEISVPEDAVVSGAVTATSQLEGRKTSAPVLAGEQIPTSRLEGSQGLPGGTLGIPEGYEAVTLPLDTPRVAGGALREGDHVTVFASFQDIGADNSLDATVSLVDDSRVLQVVGSAESGSTTSLITLALQPKDAQKTVFAQEQGSVWLGLLPPGEKGTHNTPVTQNEVIR